ncbi:MAG: hypothetical protein RLZZ40_649 [Actinomycetota bacterium]
MSTTGFSATVRASFWAVVRTPLWVTMVSTVGVLTLVATALTVFSDNATADGLDAGRMALSFVTLLTLAFALFTIPAIVDRVRHTTGASGFVDSFLTAFLVGWSLVFAATPALLWAMAATGVGADVWVPALGSLKLEVLLVDVLVAIAFGSIRKPGTATAVAYGAIASLVAGPLLVLGVTAALPGVKQTTYTWTMEWPKDGTGVDPVTGYPSDPKCPTKSATTQVVPRYDLVWAVAPVNPFALVSESVEPKLVTFVDRTYMGESEVVSDFSPRSTAPIDIFSTIAISSRTLQLPADETVTINECELLAETGQPYSSYPYGRAAADVLTNTTSGFVPGLVGQLLVAGVWIAGMLVIPRVRRQK